MKIKILLVDDQEAVLKGLRMLLALESDLQVVAVARDGCAALQAIRETQPDLVVMDVEMPGMDGISVTKALIQTAPAVKVVIHSLHADPDLRARAKEAGAIAYVEKQDGASSLIRVIRKAYESSVGR